ncbi:MAG: SPASM domain-containing protein [Candidatus Sumerlaeaceae bacterium]
MNILRNILSHRYSHRPGDPLLAVRMDITNKCNLLCKMCGYPLQAKDPKFDMPPWLMQKIVEQVLPFAEWATLSCQYEPFMSASFDEILEILRKSPCPVGLTTNATLLTERRARVLLQHPTIHGLSISFDGATKGTFERIRVNARWEKVLANLERFAAVRSELDPQREFLVQFNTVLMRSTIGELPDFVALCARLGARRIAAIRYVPIQSGLDEEISNWEPHIETLLHAKKLAHQYGIELLLPLTDPRIYLPDDTSAERGANEARIGRFSKFCEAPWRGLQIYPNGDVHPCLYYGEPFGNLAEQDFLEIWNSPKYKELRRSLAAMHLHAQCARCNPHGYDNVEKKAQINVS